MNSINRLLLLGLILIPALYRAPVARAQVDGPVYVVLEGDSYWAIADTFKVTIPDLLAANGFSANHIINPGDRLVIPGYEGIHGTLSIQTVELGETLATLALRTGVPADTLLRLNRLVNPERLYAGQAMIILEPEEGAADVTRWETGRMLSLSAGTPLVALAAAEGKNPWELTSLNTLSSQADQFSGQSLLTVGGDFPLRAWPTPLEDIQFRSLPLVQGKTGEIFITLSGDAQVAGTLGDWNLNFRELGERLATLQGIHATAAPRTYPFQVTVTLADGRTRVFEQDVLLISGNYPQEADLKVPPETLDPQTIAAESEQTRAIIAPFSEERFWDGLFLAPASKGITSLFGNRRSYNNGAYYSFHAGVDYAGRDKDPFYAPAAGRVIFTGPLTICGNATIIDHGWGVYSRYCHQHTIKVQVGEMVQPGQEIGLIGRTGRVDGPHLHWEIWVGGVQVNPLQWLEEVFP
ncbi:MAG: peptidoglycan DD-metalloendopeptidase family protein [Anaerolineales bacterium]|nr:peptidoglycan DD-metalloendopeptidase family protein [Anaerolineales bacterium]